MRGHPSHSPTTGAPAPAQRGPQATLSPSILVAALEGAREGILIFDAGRHLLHMTEECRGFLQLPAEKAFAGQDLLDTLPHTGLSEDARQSVRRLLLHLDHALPTALELTTQDNRRLHLQLRGPGPELFVAYLSEARETRATPGDVDDLTGLASRQRFELAVAECCQRGDPCAVLLLDLDRFKLVNDTLGHPIGDRLLRRVGERLRGAVRDHDVVGRLGGDEFALLVTQAPVPVAAAHVAHRLLDLVQRTYLLDGQTVNVGASIGIALAPEHGGDSDSLLRSADLAMHESKGQGRGRFCFFESALLDRAVWRRANELELRRAVPLRQLELHYQPQVSMAGALIGFEALVRWRHPQRGLVPPNEFLPVAEEMGLMNSIGEWVLRAACREAATWPAELVVAVNASPSQVENGDFTTTVCRALAASGLPGPRLEIEITEGALLRTSTVVMRTLTQLRAVGVRIAMDDFGTGYASLSQLASFPFDKIKIDRSLAGGESGDDIKKRAIVRAITALADSLGVRTLAEGVEDHAQMSRLQHDGCVEVQGYLFSRPVPAHDVPGLIAALHRRSPDRPCLPS